MTTNSPEAGAGNVAAASPPRTLRQLNPAYDRFEAGDFGSLAASLILHFIVLMGLWSASRTPRPPKPVLIEVEVIQAEPVHVASKATPSKSAKLSSKESLSKQKPPKPKQQKARPTQQPAPEIREYEMDAKVVQAGKRGAKSRKQAAKVALPDVSRPVAVNTRSVPGQAPDASAAAGLQAAEQRGALKPRMPSIGQQASSRMQTPARAGVESENGPRLIASNAPAAQTLAPEYRHSARPGGQYSSQGGAAQPAMGGGPSSEAAQPYSLQSSTLAGRAVGNPTAPRSAAQGNTAGRGASLVSGPAAATAAATSARGAGTASSAPTEIQSSGGQTQVATSGAPVNPMQIQSSGGTASKAAAAGSAAAGGGNRTTGGDASQPGGRAASRGMSEGGGQGQFASSTGGGRAVGPVARSMSAAIIPAGGGTTVRPDDGGSASAMQRVEAKAVAQVIHDRYAAQELKVNSPKSVCELPLMMAGLDRRPLPEGLASIMGSESEMVMESPPVLLPGNIQPTYPAQAMFSQLKGKVVVRAQVLANGQVGEAFLRQSTGAPVLDLAALATVRAWRFKPATRNGQPVPAWVNVPIEYRNPS